MKGLKSFKNYIFNLKFVSDSFIVSFDNMIWNVRKFKHAHTEGWEGLRSKLTNNQRDRNLDRRANTGRVRRNKQ